MAVGIVILAHQDLHRAAQLATALARQDCRVVVHVDAKVPQPAFDAFREACSGVRNLRMIPRRACEWGMFSLVEAARDGALDVLETWPEVSHVCLISGSCLPIRPIRELQAFLIAHGGTDFIESVNVGANRWVQGGLSDERFTLHFPFSWRRQRWLFDRYVTVQRRLGWRRHIPAGLQPHIGSQWWCLCRETLYDIFHDPRRKAFDRFFAKTWIPDEAYFQTLVRRHAVRIESKSLTFSRFDPQGKPHVFYSDHQGLLALSDSFFARKIWAGADDLYARYLDPLRLDIRGLEFKPKALERPFQEAMRLRTEGRPGILHPGRFPARARERQLATPRPYTVFEGFDALFPGWHRALEKHTGQTCHGRVFLRQRVELSGGAEAVRGNLPARVELRDLEPEQYLLNLLRAETGPHVSLQFCQSDSARMARFFRRDPKAALLRISDAWLITLYRDTLGDLKLARQELARIKADAATFHLRGGAEADKATIHVWSLAEALADPGTVQRRAIGLAWPDRFRATVIPAAPAPGFADFLAALRHPLAPAIREAEREQDIRRSLYERPWAEDARA